MSDPAIEASRKVFTEYWPDQGDFEFNYSSEGRFGIEVAREMAKSVQELHRPVQVVFSWTQGRILLDPCPCCSCKAGIHPCGCWGEQDVEYVCTTCRNDKGRHLQFPCETAKRVYPSEELGL